jgi:hypothetical protein
MSFYKLIDYPEEKMTDLYKFPLSTPPQMILRQFIQETEEIVVSLQKHLDLLQKNLHKPRKKSTIVLELIQDVNLLVQLQVSRNNFLNEYKANLLRKSDESNSRSKISSMELLEGFVHESRHPISSIQGWVGMINDENNLEPQIFEGFNMTLHVLKSMCNLT